MTKKMTKAEMFTRIAEVIATAPISADEVTAITDFCAHEKELLAKKKASTTSKPTKTQQENEFIKADIMYALETAGKPLTVGEIVTALNRADVTIHKASALVTQLKNAGMVTRVVDKKKAYFSVATTDSNEE